MDLELSEGIEIEINFKYQPKFNLSTSLRAFLGFAD